MFSVVYGAMFLIYGFAVFCTVLMIIFAVIYCICAWRSKKYLKEPAAKSAKLVKGLNVATIVLVIINAVVGGIWLLGISVVPQFIDMLTGGFDNLRLRFYDFMYMIPWVFMPLPTVVSLVLGVRALVIGVKVHRLNDKLSAENPPTIDITPPQ